METAGASGLAETGRVHARHPVSGPLGGMRGILRVLLLLAVLTLATVLRLDMGIVWPLG